MTVDKLGYHYVGFSYELSEPPLIIADRYEIMDFGLFSRLPVNSRAGLDDVMIQLKEEKLL
jgi:hypothetical protein